VGARISSLSETETVAPLIQLLASLQLGLAVFHLIGPFFYPSTVDRRMNAKDILIIFAFFIFIFILFFYFYKEYFSLFFQLLQTTPLIYFCN